MEEMDTFFRPKEFLEIKWTEKVEDTGEFLSEEFLLRNSATYKILNDEFTKVWSSDSEDESKKNTKENEKNKESKTVKKKINIEKWRTSYGGFTNFPQISTLSVNQQEVYLTLMKKFTNNHSPFLTPEEKKDLQTYMTLHDKVLKEQLQYTNFLKEYALANQSRYVSIQPGIRKYVNELWKSKLKIPLKYPQYYEMFRTIPLVFREKSWKIEMQSEDAALEVGDVFYYKAKNLNAQMSTNYEKFKQKHPIKNEDYLSDSSLPKKYPVSLDKNANILAKLKNAEFVISSSGLKRLCDNHGPLFQKSWELPVMVKEYDSHDGKSKKKIIFIDKALPRKKMGVIDKIIWFYKIGIKTYCVNVNTKCTVKLKLEHPPKKKNPSTPGRISDDAETESFIKTTEKTDDFEGRESVNKSNTKENLAETTNKEQVCGEISSHSSALINDELCSSDISDSDEDNLVIEENLDDDLTPKKVGTKMESPKLKSDPPKNLLPTTPESKLKKPVTRSVSKMLDNLTKIEKLIGKKETNSTGIHPVARNLMAEKSTEIVERDQSVSEENNREKGDELPKQQTVGIRKNGGVRKDILDELIENQKKMFGGNEKLLELANSDQKFLRKREVFDFDPTPVPEGCNYVYRPFILRSKESCGKSFRTLVRCKYDAADSINKEKMITIVPKLEFQPEFGAEAATVSEITRQWLCLLMKPNSKLIRARINAFTSNLIMIEEMEMKDIIKEERKHGMQVSSCLSTLYSVFQALADIPPGQYILSHNAKLGAFANLYHAIGRARDGCYDLHKEYEIDVTVEEPQNIANLWNPIDYGIITPFHETFNRIPGTFNPCENSKSKGKKKKKK